MKNRLHIFLLWMCSRVLLDVAYLYFVSPLFSYASLVTDVQANRLISSYAIAVAWTFGLSSKNESVGEVVFLLLSVLVVLPMTSLWGLSDQPDMMMLLVLAGMLIFKVGVAYPRMHMVLPRLKHAPGMLLVALISLLMVAAFFGILFARGGLRNLNFNPVEVYAYRGEVGKDLGFVGGYLANWVPKVLIPVWTAYFYWHRRYWAVLLLVCLAIFTYGMTSYKEVVVYPFVVIFFMHVVGRGKNITRQLLLANCVMLLVVLLIGWFFQARLFTATFISRTFHVVALNHFDYYTFSQHHPPIYWSNSWLGMLSGYRYPYDVPVSMLIGAGRYNLVAETSANAGFLASGVVQAGPLGVFVYSLTLALVVRVAEMVAHNVPKSVALAVFAVAFMQLVNGDLLTAMITGGIAPALWVVFFVSGRENWQRISLRASGPVAGPL